MREADGTLHAVAALCEAGDDTILMLPDDRMIRVEQPMAKVLGWLEPNGPIAGRHPEADDAPARAGCR